MGRRKTSWLMTFWAKEAIELSESSCLKASLKGFTLACIGQGLSSEHCFRLITQRINLSASPICSTTLIKGASFSWSDSQNPPPGPLLELITFFLASVCNIFAKKGEGIWSASATSFTPILRVTDECTAK